MVVRIERRHQPGSNEDEERRDAAEAEQRQPEERRGDAPRSPPLPLFEQVAEDGDERGRERRVGDQRPDGVGDEERDLERVHGPADAEVVLGDDLANQTEDAGEARGEREDRRRPGQPSVASGRGLSGTDFGLLRHRHGA